MSFKQNASDSDKRMYRFAGIVCVLITVSAVLTAVYLTHTPGKDFVMILPLYISLVVMVLTTQVNRYAFLLGGINSVFYAVVYLIFGLYGSAVQTLVISFPIQIATFINWGRKPYRQATVFKKLNAKTAVWVLVGTVAVYALLCAFTVGKEPTPTDKIIRLMDMAVLLLGIVTPVLTMLAYVDYQYYNIACMAANLVLYFFQMPGNPERTPYFIYALYSAVCVIIAARNVFGIYRAQKEEAAGAAQTKGDIQNVG